MVGSVFKNPDLASTYEEVGSQGVDALYRGKLADDIVRTVRNPPVDPASTRVVRPGDLTTKDLRSYRALRQKPTKAGYRGLDVYGMAPSSSGGTSVGEALNILESTDLSKASQARYLHRYIEASPSPSRTGGAGSVTRRSRTCRPRNSSANGSPTRGSA